MPRFLLDSHLHPFVPCSGTYNLMAPFFPKVFIPLTSHLSFTAPHYSTRPTHPLYSRSWPSGPQCPAKFQIAPEACGGSGRGRAEARRTRALVEVLIRGLLSFPSELPRLIISFAEAGIIKSCGASFASFAHVKYLQECWQSGEVADSFRWPWQSTCRRRGTLIYPARDSHHTFCLFLVSVLTVPIASVSLPAGVSH